MRSKAEDGVFGRRGAGSQQGLIYMLLGPGPQASREIVLTAENLQ